MSRGTVCSSSTGVNLVSSHSLHYHTQAVEIQDSVLSELAVLEKSIAGMYMAL